MTGRRRRRWWTAAWRNTTDEASVHETASFAVAEEEDVAVTLGYGVGGVAGRRDGRSERGGLVVEEAPDRTKVLLDLGAPGSGPGMLEQAEAETLESVPRGP